MAIAGVLLQVLQLVEAGFNLKALVDKVHKMQSEGATEEQVSQYLKNLRDATLTELKNL